MRIARAHDTHTHTYWLVSPVHTDRDTVPTGAEGGI